MSTFVSHSVRGSFDCHSSPDCLGQIAHVMPEIVAKLAHWGLVGNMGIDYIGIIQGLSSFIPHRISKLLAIERCWLIAKESSGM